MASSLAPKVSSFDVIIFPSSAFASPEEQRMLPTGVALQYVKPIISTQNYPVSVVLSLDIESVHENARRWESGSRFEQTEKEALRAVEINLIQRDQKLKQLIGRSIRPGDIVFLVQGEMGAMVLADNTLYYLDKHEVQVVRGGLLYTLLQPKVIEEMTRRDFRDCD